MYSIHRWITVCCIYEGGRERENPPGHLTFWCSSVTIQTGNKSIFNLPNSTLKVTIQWEHYARAFASLPQTTPTRWTRCTRPDIVG